LFTISLNECRLRFIARWGYARRIGVGTSEAALPPTPRCSNNPA
jgi:hypothetical protein